MKKLFILTALMIVISGCAQQAEMPSDEGMEGQVIEPAQEEEMAASYVDVSPDEAKNLIDTTDIIAIDVSPHYDKGHLPGAVHYYLGDGS